VFTEKTTVAQRKLDYDVLTVLVMYFNLELISKIRKQKLHSPFRSKARANLYTYAPYINHGSFKCKVMTSLRMHVLAPVATLYFYNPLILPTFFVRMGMK